jgi:hypothetical protein
MKRVSLLLILLALFAPTTAAAQTPTPPATPPVTTVAQFPSTPQYLRAWPGLEEDSWYVYASGFTARVGWLIGEVPCGVLPCDQPLRAPVNDLVKEDGTMTFYVRLPKATDPSTERLLAVSEGVLTGSGTTTVTAGADAPSIRVAGHNPGVGLGYPASTRTGIQAVDEIIALSLAHDTEAIRSRVIPRDRPSSSGPPVPGIATFQCAPYVLALDSNVFEYPSGSVYAVFRVPAQADLPLRYKDASYGIAWYDGGAGIPLGGLTLVSADGRITGTEIRCGTTPGYHVHNFTDFILPPFVGPPVAPEIPKPPEVGNSTLSTRAPALDPLLLGPAALALGLFATATWWARRR